MNKNRMVATIVAFFVAMGLFSVELMAENGRMIKGDEKRGEFKEVYHHRKFRRRHRHRRFFFGNVERLKRMLNLTEQQVNKIERINLRFKKKHLSFKENIAPLRYRLRRLLLEDNVNLTKVRRVLKKIERIKFEIRFHKIKHRIAIEKILTPKQKRKIRSMKHRRKFMRGMRFHRGRGMMMRGRCRDRI